MAVRVWVRMVNIPTRTRLVLGGQSGATSWYASTNRAEGTLGRTLGRGSCERTCQNANDMRENISLYDPSHHTSPTFLITSIIMEDILRDVQKVLNRDQHRPSLVLAQRTLTTPAEIESEEALMNRLDHHVPFDAFEGNESNSLGK